MLRRSLLLLVTTVLLASLAPAAAFAEMDDISGGASPLVLSPTVQTLNAPADTDDWYSLEASAGDEITLSLTSPTAGTDFSISLYDAEIGTEPEIDQLFSLWFWSGAYPRETSYIAPHDGKYYVQLHMTEGQGAAGTYSLAWSLRHDRAARLFGRDRYQTSAAISRSSFASATTAVLASGENYPDALSASGLAGVLECPVLLTRKTYVPTDVMLELQRLHVTSVYIVGSEKSVSGDVETALEDANLTIAERFAGADRVWTAALVAQRIAAEGGSRDVFLVTGYNYADALSVAPVAFGRKMPVLLTRPDVLSSPTQNVLAALDTTHVVIAGSTPSVSSVAANAAAGICAGNAAGGEWLVDRWAGTNRYATAASVAESATELGWAGWSGVALATGKNFPDALGGAAAAGSKGGVLLLTEPQALRAEAGDELSAHKADIARAFLLGSTATLTQQVRADAESRLAP